MMSETLDMPLPCDVEINHIRYRKGVKLRTLVDAARRWHTMLSASTASPEGLGVSQEERNSLPSSETPMREAIAKLGVAKIVDGAMRRAVAMAPMDADAWTFTRNRTVEEIISLMGGELEEARTEDKAIVDDLMELYADPAVQKITYRAAKEILLQWTRAQAAEAQVSQLREALEEIYAGADVLQRIGFSIPAPNRYTPEIVQFAIGLKSRARLALSSILNGREDEVVQTPVEPLAGQP